METAYLSAERRWKGETGAGRGEIESRDSGGGRGPLVLGVLVLLGKDPVRTL